MDDPKPTPHLFVDQNMSKGEVLSLGSGAAGVFSQRSPAKTTPNEDAAALLSLPEASAVLVVADGAGGQQAGELASSTAVRELCASVVEAASRGEPMRSAILNGFERANEAIVSLGVGAATTLAVVLIDGRTVRTFHAGDSMILVCGQRGRVKLQTISHSPVGYALEAGFLNDEDAMHHDERHLVSNIVGTTDMRIEVGPTVELAPRDTLVLASDGLFDNLRIDEVVDRIRKGALDRVLGDLAGDCLERMHHPVEGHPSKADDLTFIVFRLTGARKEAAAAALS